MPNRVGSIQPLFIAAAIFSWVAGLALAQTAAAPVPQFELASIKPSASGQVGTFIRPGPNGGLNIGNMAVKEMITFAWRIQPFQISGGPSWIESAHYDIIATPDHKPKRDEIRLMMQSLLEDRFRPRGAARAEAGIAEGSRRHAGDRSHRAPFGELGLEIHICCANAQELPRKS